MKITTNITPLSDAPTAEANRRTASPAAPASIAGGSTVALSQLSSALARPDGDIDMDRVEAIRQAIRSGELQIDASRLADGLLESVRELTGRQS